jgi:hypothetical protein
MLLVSVNVGLKCDMRVRRATEKTQSVTLQIWRNICGVLQPNQMSFKTSSLLLRNLGLSKAAFHEEVAYANRHMRSLASASAVRIAKRVRRPPWQP